MYDSGNPQQKLLALQAQRESMKKELDQTVIDLNQQWDKLDKLNVFSADIESQRESLNVTKNTLNQLQSQYELAKIEAENPLRITKYDEAQTPKENDALRKYLILIGLSVVGFVAVVAGVSRLEFQTRRVNSSAEVTEGLGLRLMGDLPPLHQSNWQRLFTFRAPRPPFCREWLPNRSTAFA